jgi:hypothetical protein
VGRGLYRPPVSPRIPANRFPRQRLGTPTNPFRRLCAPARAPECAPARVCPHLDWPPRHPRTPSVSETPHNHQSPSKVPILSSHTLGSNRWKLCSENRHSSQGNRSRNSIAPHNRRSSPSQRAQGQTGSPSPNRLLRGLGGHNSHSRVCPNRKRQTGTSAKPGSFEDPVPQPTDHDFGRFGEGGIRAAR